MQHRFDEFGSCNDFNLNFTKQNYDMPTVISVGSFIIAISRFYQSRDHLHHIFNTLPHLSPSGLDLSLNCLRLLLLLLNASKTVSVIASSR
jgi:hypothetical protein